MSFSRLSSLQLIKSTPESVTRSGQKTDKSTISSCAVYVEAYDIKAINRLEEYGANPDVCSDFMYYLSCTHRSSNHENKGVHVVLSLRKQQQCA